MQELTKIGEALRIRTSANKNPSSGEIFVTVLIEVDVCIADRFQDEVVLAGRGNVLQLLMNRAFLVINELVSDEYKKGGQDRIYAQYLLPMIA
jgi:hypothetical protein